tara:strand:- start:493 stop:1803 length:1311 start_codon:yes stop_codon:yes gene_type:complete
MTQTVQLKRSATAGAIPSTSDLALGELALNTYDGKAYIKKSVGGTESIVEVGADDSTDITDMKHYLFNCSANQTSFSGTDANGDSLSYTSGQLAVFLNGVFLDPDDYTSTNGSAVVLDEGAKSSDYLEIVSWTAGVSSGLITGISNYEFTATAGQTVLTGADENSITLSYTPGKVLVFLNGVLMDNRGGSDYTETSATTITFTAGLQVGDTVIIKSYTGSAPFTRFQYDITAASTSSVSGNDANNRTLSIIPKYSEVFVNGVLVKKGQWSSGSGTQVNFEEALTDPNYVIDIIDYGFVTPEVNLFLDTVPFLGGNLDTNGKEIISSGTQAVTLTTSTYVDVKGGPVHLEVLASDPSVVTNRASLYCKDVSASAELFVRDEAGNVTQISPHNTQGEWIYYSENVKTGKKFKVNMEKMIRKLEQITGEDFIEIDDLHK